MQVGGSPNLGLVLDAATVLLQIVSSRPLGGLGRLLAAVRHSRASSWLFLGVVYEVLLVAALGTLVFYWRLLGLEQVEIGGDALKVWEFARQLAHGAGLPSEFNHHIARFGMVIPVLVAQLVFGSDAWVYYVAPLAASVVLHLSVYGIARKISGRFGGILAVVLLLGFGEMVRPSSQILPELFGPAYVCAAYLAALFYTDATGRRARVFWLALTALLLFGAYGSKISYLYYAPGAALLVWRGRRTPLAASSTTSALDAGAAAGDADGADKATESAALVDGSANRATAAGSAEAELDEAGGGRTTEAEPSRRTVPRTPRWQALLRFPGGLWRWIEARGLKNAALLTGMVVACIAAEVLFYVVFTRHTSQLDVINETHGLSRSARVKELAGFFAIYQNAGAEWHKWLTVGFLAMLGLAATARDRRASLIVISLVVYLFLQTFILRKFNPPIPWIRPHPRYLLAVAAPLMIVIGAFVHEASARVASKIGALRRRPTLRHALSGVFGLVVLLSTASELREGWDKRWTQRHAFFTTQRNQEVLSEAFAQGIPIVTKMPGAKPLRAAGSLYIHPRLLMIDGELRPYRDFQARAAKGLFYLAREVAEPGVKRKPIDREVAERTRKRRCVIELSQRYRFLTGRIRLPSGCAPLAAPTP